MRSRRIVASLRRSIVGEIMFSRISWARKERWGDAVHRCRSLEPGTVLAVLDLEIVATGRSSQLGGSRTPSAASTAAALFSLQFPLAAVLSGASGISSALHHTRPGIMIIIVLVRIATVIVVVMVVASSSPSSSFLYALSSLSSSSPPSSSSSSRRHRLHHYDLGIKKVPCCPLCLPPRQNITPGASHCTERYGHRGRLQAQRFSDCAMSCRATCPPRKDLLSPLLAAQEQISDGEARAQGCQA